MTNTQGKNPLQASSVAPPAYGWGKHAGTSLSIFFAMSVMVSFYCYLLNLHVVDCFMQLQRAAKFLDSGAVRATKFLWRYPIARMILLFYLVRTNFSIAIILRNQLHKLNVQCCKVSYIFIFFGSCQVFVHLFLMYLLHRLQVSLSVNDY